MLRCWCGEAGLVYRAITMVIRCISSQCRQRPAPPIIITSSKNRPDLPQLASRIKPAEQETWRAGQTVVITTEQPQRAAHTTVTIAASQDTSQYSRPPRPSFVLLYCRAVTVLYCTVLHCTVLCDAVNTARCVRIKLRPRAAIWL